MDRGSHLLLVAHGSRRKSANQEVSELAARLNSAVKFAAVSSAFLELAEPSIPDAIDYAVLAGAKRIVIMPYFLSEGRHVGEDIPNIVSASRLKHDDCEIEITPYLGQSPAIVEVLQGLFEQQTDLNKAKPTMSVVGLCGVVDDDFPKTCRNCGRTYQTMGEFIRDTVSTIAGAGLKQGFTDDEQAIVELFRHCQCGSTLMSPGQKSRRGNSDLASECREQFDQLVAQMAAAGKTHESAREDLRQVITGGYGDILEQLKKISRPKRPS
ncbi:MAG: CbiX/SirB N-terminal domain-containing protein [Thiotrichales bacterium]|nr:CbiX/SirB N-terminal domain-containing protein [Thiotrichales bacterium]